MLTPADLYTYRATVSRVVDGDTAVFDVDLGGKVHAFWDCRMRGYDAPKRTSAPGKTATARLTQLLAGDLLIRTHKDEDDRYGRYLVEVQDASGFDVATRIVQEGLCVPWDGHGGHPDQPGHE